MVSPGLLSVPGDVAVGFGPAIDLGLEVGVSTRIFDGLDELVNLVAVEIQEARQTVVAREVGNSIVQV